MKADNLRDIFYEQLNDMYSAETQLVEALPKLAEAASSQQLKQAFNNHLQVTRQHVQKVGQILEEAGMQPGKKKCKGMEGLVKEADEMMKMQGAADARDAALVSAAQKSEHYEIATYGSLRTWAQVMGKDDIAETLQSVLDDEYHADDTLTSIAESYLNEDADR